MYRKLVKYLQINLFLPSLVVKDIKVSLSRACSFLSLKWVSSVVSTTALRIGSTLAGWNSNMSQSCRSCRSYLASNAPAVICPASHIFFLCIQHLLVSNRLKGTSMPISEVLFLHSSLLSSTLPHTFPAAPAFSNSDLCLLNPMTLLC